MANTLMDTLAPSSSTDARSAPAAVAFAITPDNSNDLAVYTRGIMVNVAGNIVVDFVQSGSSITLTLLAGQIYPFHLKRVRSATATGLVGLA